MCMKKKLFHQFVRFLLSSLLLWALGKSGQALWTHVHSPAPAAPQAQRQLLTVWLRADNLPVADFVRRQAAAFEKTHKGVSIWVRTVSPSDLALLDRHYDTAAPDVLLFSAGENVLPTWFSPLGNFPYLGSHRQSGRHEGEILAAPVCMSGYALIMQTQEKAATPVPTSIFGVTPAPDFALPDTTPVPRDLWPTDLAADQRLGAGLLSLLDAPLGARLMERKAVQEAFAQNQVQAALLTIQQVHSLQSQGKGMQLLAAVPASDLMLFGGVMHNAATDAYNFMTYLLSEESQRTLREYALLPVRQGIRLYGSDTPILQALELALKGGWLPHAFTWPDVMESTIHTAQALYAAGDSARPLFMP